MSLDSSAINRAQAAAVAADLRLITMIWIHTGELKDSNRSKLFELGHQLSGFSSRTSPPWLEILIAVLESPEVLGREIEVQDIALGLLALADGTDIDRDQAMLIAGVLKRTAKALLIKPDNPGERIVRLAF